MDKEINILNELQDVMAYIDSKIDCGTTIELDMNKEEDVLIDRLINMGQHLWRMIKY